MVEIGGQPILWHIMKNYAHYGFNDFVIALGYKGEYIKRYMLDYCVAAGRPDGVAQGRRGRGSSSGERRGLDGRPGRHRAATPMTGGRIKRLAPYLGDETFMLTWGDGVSTVDLHELLDFHRAHGKLATVTAVRPPARFGQPRARRRRASSSSPRSRRPARAGSTAPSSSSSRASSTTSTATTTQFEREPLERLAADGQLMAYQHDGFWQCMDTLRDKVLLEELWAEANAALEDLGAEP